MSVLADFVKIDILIAIVNVRNILNGAKNMIHKINHPTKKDIWTQSLIQKRPGGGLNCEKHLD